MRELVALYPNEIEPSDGDLLGLLGAPQTVGVLDRWKSMIWEARREFSRLVDPRAIWRTVSAETARRVFEGEGDNADVAPLQEMIPEASQLRLFVVTVGNKVMEAARRLTERGEYPAAVVLDGLAGLAVDRAVRALEARMASEMQSVGLDSSVLAYSPGYCGWHLSGQRALFDALSPEDVGVELLPSLIMKPLKSASGILVGGPAAMHEFEAGFDFCSECDTLECRQRLDRIRRSAGRNGGQDGEIRVHRTDP